MSDPFLAYYLHQRIEQLGKELRDKGIEHDAETDIFVRGGIEELERMLKIIEQNGYLGWEDGP